MTKTKCKVCGKMYKRQSCEYCTRAKRWDDKYILDTFTPRIQRDLKKYEIKTLDQHINRLNNNQSIVFTSDAGTGKTLYACQLLIDTLKNNFIEGNYVGKDSFKFLSLPEFFQQLKNKFDGGQGVDFEQIKTVHYLIIDDIGVESASSKSSDWYLNMLYLLINYRYEYMLPTIYTTNLDTDEFSRSMDDRIASRLFNECKIVNYKR